MQKDIAERLKDFPTLVKLAMLGDVVSAQAIETFSRDAKLEIEMLRTALATIRDETADFDTSYKPDRLKHRIFEVAEAALPPRI